MYKLQKNTQTSIERNLSTVAETIEEKIRRALTNGEKLDGQSELQYTERKDGVRPEFNVRTDKWDLAVESIEKFQQDKALLKEKKEAEKLENDNNGETPMKIVK